MTTKKGGRPSIPVNADQIEKLAARWLTKDAIADFLGIARSTLYDKMKADPEIEELFGARHHTAPGRRSGLAAGLVPVGDPGR
jgi:hypothetical protein